MENIALKFEGSFTVQLEDVHWQQYYQERKALDYRYKQASKPSGNKAAARWQEDFALPAMEDVCKESYADQDGSTPAQELVGLQKHVVKRLSSCLRGCKTLGNQTELQKTIKGAFYFLEYW